MGWCTPWNIFAATLTLRCVWRKKWCYYSNQHIVHRGWRILIPYEDKVDVITPINIFFIEGGGFWSLMKISWCFYPNQHIVHRRGANFDPSCKYSWCYPNQHIVQRGWQNLTPHEDKVDFFPQSTYCSEGVANFNVMMTMRWWWWWWWCWSWLL